MGKTDLYVSLNRGGQWGPRRNLGPLVNSAASEACPAVSPDGRHFFFTSTGEGGPPRIYQIDIGALRLAD
jgi:hypothetical protein